MRLRRTFPPIQNSNTWRENHQAHWAEVDAVVAEERRTASLELRWQQLNAAYAMAIGLGLHLKDPSERGVIERWAKLKERAASHT